MAIPGRALTSAEREVLDVLLEPRFLGVEQLRAQLAHVVVVGRCKCGCPTIDLQVPATTTPAAIQERVSPVEAEILPSGEETPGSILLFLDHGRLATLEYVYYGDKIPTLWPPRDRLRTTIHQ